MLPPPDEPDRLPHAPHPRETLALVGHAAQARAFIEALASGRTHHAWLLGGPEGIAKASFAYRAAFSRPGFCQSRREKFPSPPRDLRRVRPEGGEEKGASGSGSLRPREGM